MRTCSFNHKEVVYDDCKYNCPLCDTCEKLITHLPQLKNKKAIKSAT